jgi:hypothetical protein
MDIAHASNSRGYLMNKALSYQNHWYSTQPEYINSIGAVKMFLLIESKTNPDKTTSVNIPDNMLNSEIPQLARNEIEKINNQPKRT